MCGRYAASKKSADLVEEFEVDDPPATELPPDFNVAPSKQVYAVLSRADSDGDLARQLRTVRWGLIPSWAKDSAIGSRLINARVETLGEKPAFRRAFASRRCLLPADGYYEWFRPQGDSALAKPRKQPFYIHRADGVTLAMAGLYEIWRDPTMDPDDPSSLVWSVTVITTPAGPDVSFIHERMPLTIESVDWQRWLDPKVPATALSDLVDGIPPVRLEAYPVGDRVNRVSNNGPELRDPVVFQADTPLDEAPDIAD